MAKRIENNLAQIMKERGIQQVQMAHKLGISPPRVHQMINANSLSLKTALKIIDALNLETLDDLFKITDLDE